MAPAMGNWRSVIVAVVFTLAGICLVTAQDLSAERIAQQLLLDRGFDIGAVDGIWGPRSAAAMSQLQRDLGLKVTGLPDAATLEAILSAARPQPAAPVESQASAEVEPAAPQPTPIAPAQRPQPLPKPRRTYPQPRLSPLRHRRRTLSLRGRVRPQARSRRNGWPSLSISPRSPCWSRCSPP